MTEILKGWYVLDAKGEIEGGWYAVKETAQAMAGTFTDKFPHLAPYRVVRLGIITNDLRDATEMAPDPDDSADIVKAYAGLVSAIAIHPGLTPAQIATRLAFWKDACDGIDDLVINYQHDGSLSAEFRIAPQKTEITS